MIFKVTINASDNNHWSKYGLSMNPFPQLAKAEYGKAMMQLNSLDGDPMKSVDEIDERLEGFHPAFVELCRRHYVPGQRVRFDVEVPDEVMGL
jgi:hypothetical protein